MKRVVFAGVGLALLAAAGGGAWYWFTEGRFIQSTDNAYVKADIAVISPKLAGYVQAVAVEDNRVVHAGDVLVKIDDRDYAARVAAARAQVASQKAAIASDDAHFALQQTMIAQAQATIDNAQAEVERTKLDLARQRSLVRDAYTPQQKLETAEADWRKATSTLARAQAALNTEREQLTVIQAGKALDATKLAQAEADLDAATLDLDNTVIRAPIDGVVGNKAVQVGQYLRPGTQILSVVPVADVYIVANFKETQIRGMKPGQPVTVTVDALPGMTLKGHIDSFAPASGSEFSLLPPENATGNFTKVVQRVPVRVALDPDSQGTDARAPVLRPGLSVEVAVDVRSPGKATPGPQVARSIDDRPVPQPAAYTR